MNKNNKAPLYDQLAKLRKLADSALKIKNYIELLQWARKVLNNLWPIIILVNSLLSDHSTLSHQSATGIIMMTMTMVIQIVLRMRPRR